MPKILALPPIFVVEAFEREDGELRRVARRACADAGAARKLAESLAPAHAGVIAWSRRSDPASGDYAAVEVLFRAGETPER
jgi:hypothetical protein